MSDKQTFLVERVPIDSIVPLPANPRAHSLRNITTIAKSLEAFGQIRALVVRSETNEIICGNGTWEAAKRLGWQEILIVRRNLTDDEAGALAIIDNRTAELAAWDAPILLDGIEALKADGVDLDLLGFSLDELLELTPKDQDAGSGGDESQDDPWGEPIKLTREQRAVFDQAAVKFRQQEADETLSEGRIVELLAADALSGM